MFKPVDLQRSLHMIGILAHTFRVASRTEPPRHPLNPKRDISAQEKPHA